MHHQWAQIQQHATRNYTQDALIWNDHRDQPWFILRHLFLEECSVHWIRWRENHIFAWSSFSVSFWFNQFKQPYGLLFLENNKDTLDERLNMLKKTPRNIKRKLIHHRFLYSSAVKSFWTLDLIILWGWDHFKYAWLHLLHLRVFLFLLLSGALMAPLFQYATLQICYFLRQP